MQISIFWYENRSSNGHSIDSHNAGQHHYKLPQNLSDFTVPLHTAGVGDHQARRVLSVFTSAWVYMNMHDCRVLGAIHQQSVQHATTIRLTADLHSRAWLSILLRSTSAEIRLLRFKRFPREQTWLNFYIWFDWWVNIKSPCENDDASYRAFKELLINVNRKWGSYRSFQRWRSGVEPQTVSSLAWYLHTPADSWMNKMQEGVRGSLLVGTAKTNHAKKREQSFGDESTRRRAHLNSIMRLLWSPCCGRWCNKMTASIWTMQQGSSERFVMHTSTRT